MIAVSCAERGFLARDLDDVNTWDT